jgi:hypothetical protein
MVLLAKMCYPLVLCYFMFFVQSVNDLNHGVFESKLYNPPVRGL